MHTWNPVDLIASKRDGMALSADAIKWLIDAYTHGTLPDYQMSAFLMASFLQGMDGKEAFALAEAMLYSGDVLDLSHIPGHKVDKHSTGGVGDKVSLILAPLVAACGVPVPMISGRGLGHSGGTLDKLESIPGFRTDLSTEAYIRQLEDIGVVMIGQTVEIAPADRKLYALRDVTATVEFIPFIAASIMSKKLAEGIDALVLDVKCGKGAFMKTETQARALAETLVGVGEHFGKTAVALLTAMDAPLGYGVGNWPETAEAIRCLQGEDVPDLMEVVYALAGEMLWLGNVASSPQEGERQARQVLASGAAFQKMLELVERQGGDVRVIEDISAREGAHAVAHVTAHASGYIVGIDALAIGKTAVALGAGRVKKEETVDPTAGITLHKKPGDLVEAGNVLASIHTTRHQAIPACQTAIQSAFTISETTYRHQSMLLDRYTIDGWSSAQT